MSIAPNKPACKYGADCRSTSDVLHVETYTHPCKYGTDCRNTGNETHMKRFTHSAVLVVGQTTIDPVNHTEQTDILLVGLERKHKKEPCKWGTSCKNTGDPVHTGRYTHPHIHH